MRVAGNTTASVLEESLMDRTFIATSESVIAKEYIPLAHLDDVRAACARHSELQSELRENHRGHEALLSSFKLMIEELSL
jgi:hypothetical protein